MQLKPLLAGILFGLAGFAGNWFNFELFFGVNLLFGTFFVMLALLRYGPVAGITAGILASTCTFFLWNHPWAIVIYLLEIIFVAFLFVRRRFDPLSAVIIYWCIPGALLFWFFYHGVMAIPLATVWLIILKQAINAIMNTLLARCVDLLYAYWRPADREQRPGYREYIRVNMLFLVLVPALLYIVLDIREQRADHLEDARRRVSHTANLTRSVVDAWVAENHQTIKALAAVISETEQLPVAAMQQHAEMFLASSISFQRIGVMNQDAISIAYAPPVDELGRSTLGLNFSDRPYFKVLRERQQPMVGDVQMGRVGRPAPSLPLLAPIVSGGEFKGYCGGILDLSRLQELLGEVIGPRNLVITLLDRQGLVITSTDPHRQMMKPWLRSGGEARMISADALLWLPELESGMNTIQRWRQAYYFSESKVSQTIGWTVLAEAPLLPALTDITRVATSYFLLMMGLILLTVGFAFFISRWQSRPVIALQRLTEQVARHPERLVADNWPSSSIHELEALSCNLKQMADSLHHTIAELFTLNRELENLVAVRTSDYQKSEERLRLAMGAARQGWFDANVQTGEIVVSPEYPRMLGYEPDEFISSVENWMDNLHPEDSPAVREAYWKCLESGGATTMEYRRRTKAGDWLWLSSTGKVIQYDNARKPMRMIGIHADISERKQIEEELRASEEKYHNLYRYAALGIFHSTFEGRFIDVNPALARMLGYDSPEEAVSLITDIAEQIYVEPARHTAVAGKALTADGFVSTENCYRRRDGTLWYGMLYLRTVHDRQGMPSHYEGLIEDITERKQAEEALLKERHYLKVLNDAVGETIFTVKLPGYMIEYANRRIRESFGYTGDELVGQTMERLYASKESYRAFECKIQQTIEQGESICHDEQVLQKKGGESFDGEITTSIVWENGQAVRVISLIRDITHRKEVAEKLRESEERFRSLFEKVHVVALVIDPADGSIVDANAAAVAFYGWPRVQLLAMRISEINTLPPEAVQQEMAAARSEERSYFLFRHRRSDSSIRDVEVYSGPIQSGGQILLYSIVHDITEKKRVETQLKESEELFSLLMRYTPVYTFIKSLAGGQSRVISVSDNFEKMIGMPAASMIGKAMDELFPAEFARKITDDDLAVVASGKNIELEETLNGRNYTTIKFPITRQDGTRLLAGFTIDITERKRVEEKLRESEERYRSLVEHSSVWIWETDSSLHHVYCNAFVEELLGYQLDEFMKIDLKNLVHEEDHPILAATIDQAINHKTGWRDLVLRWRHRDGSWRFLLSSGTPFFTADGKFLGIRGVDQDITGRKQVEEKLRESERWFRSIFEQAAVGVALIDSNSGGFIQVNQRYCAVVGHEETELLATDYLNITYPEDLPKNLENMDRLRQGEIPLFMMEKRYIRSDGGITWANLSVSPLWLPGEPPTRHIAIIQDITAYKQAEEALRQSEHRFRTLITEMSNGFALHEIILDGGGRPCDYRYLEVNRAFERLTGLKAERVSGRTVLELLPETEPSWIETFGKVALTGQAAQFENYSRALGRYFEVLAYSPQSGQFATVFTDITDRKAVEQEILEFNRTLEARVEAETRARLERERMLVQQSKMAAMGEMIGAIAHQWRQPLNAVAVIVQDIREAFEAGLLDKEYLQQGVESAMSQVRFMSKTIDDFRDFFRPDKVRTTFDAKKAMAEVIKMMTGQCLSHSISCSIACLVHGKNFIVGEPIEVCDEMRITGYKNELKQVFLNLLDNAKDAILERRRATESHTEGTILVEFDRQGERVVVRVTDNGGGIPEAILDRVFEPYFTTKEQGKGTGIGLYMAKMIIENNMGGRISARNTAEGAEFTIVI